MQSQNCLLWSNERKEFYIAYNKKLIETAPILLKKYSVILYTVFLIDCAFLKRLSDDENTWSTCMKWAIITTGYERF